MTPPRLAFLSAAASALLCLGEAESPRNGSLAGIVDATTFFKQPSELLSVPLRRVDQDGVGTPSLAKRFFKTDVLGVFGAAYLAKCRSSLSSLKNNARGPRDPEKRFIKETEMLTSARSDDRDGRQAGGQCALRYRLLRALGQPGLRQVQRTEALSGLRAL